MSRLNILPPKSVAIAQLGYNDTNHFTDLNSLRAIQAAGGSIVRAQFSWGSTSPNQGVENIASPGTYSLGASVEAALAWCGANGMSVCAVCGFGPPWSNPFDLTVGVAGASIGDLIVPVTGSVSSLVTPTDHVALSTTSEVTAKGMYYGSLIDSFDAGAGTITLASPLTVNLTSGQTLHVYRLLYPAPADQLITNPSVIAYFNYMKYVAARMAANNVSGWVEMWNEPPWPNDFWHARGAMYSSVPGGMNTNARMPGFLNYVKANASTLLPYPNIGFINGATGKTGSAGVTSQGLGFTAAQVTALGSNNVGVPGMAECIHPYVPTGNPEGYEGWDPTYSGYPALNTDVTIDAAGNFNALAKSQATANIGLGLIATELGNGEADDTRQAVEHLRRVLTTWGIGAIAIPYAFAEGGLSAVAGTGPSYTLRQAGAALQRLMALVAWLGKPGGSNSKVPIVVGAPDGPNPLMGMSLVGKNGVLFCLWQRTRTLVTSPGWDTVAAPATLTAEFYVPSGLTLVSATYPLDGSSASPAPTISGNTLTVPGIGEHPLVLKLT